MLVRLARLTMPTVTFVNEKKTIEVPEGANLRTEALKNGVELYPGIHKTLNCRGNGLCCSCRVLVKSGEQNINKQGWWEKLNMFLNPIGFFARIGHEKDCRLACQTKVFGDCEIETRPPLNLHGEEKFWA